MDSGLALRAPRNDDLCTGAFCSNLPHAFCLPRFAAIGFASSVCDLQHMPVAAACAAFLGERMENIFTLI